MTTAIAVTTTRTTTTAAGTTYCYSALLTIAYNYCKGRYYECSTPATATVFIWPDREGQVVKGRVSHRSPVPATGAAVK